MQQDVGGKEKWSGTVYIIKSFLNRIVKSPIAPTWARERLKVGR